MTNFINPRVWGVSRIRDLHQCPRMFVAKYEWKKWVQEDESDAMRRGSRFHSTVEESIKYDVIMPDEPMFNNVRDYVDMLCGMKRAGITVVPEHKFGVDVSFNRVDFFRAQGLRARVGLDVYVNDNGKALVIDWKTGRYKPEHINDADFYGAATFITHKPQTLEVQYIYADDPQCSFSRVIEKPEAMMTEFWRTFDKADEYLEGEGEDGEIRLVSPPVNPGKYCSYCGDVTCPQNKNDKAKQMALKAEKTSALLFKG